MTKKQTELKTANVNLEPIRFDNCNLLMFMNLQLQQTRGDSDFVPEVGQAPAMSN